MKARDPLDAKCSQCGQPFRDHKSHMDPTSRGGFRFSMTCPKPASQARSDDACEGGHGGGNV